MCAVGVYTGRGLATRAAVAAARFCMNVAYRVCCVMPRRDEVLFFSRQANEPSRDFVALGEQFARRGLAPVFMTKKLSARSAVPYALFAVREIYHLARCRVCVLDRYDPVVSLLDFRCESDAGCVGDGSAVAGVAGAEGGEPAASKRCSLPLYEAFPAQPVVVQLWHAFGAFKKFGYQSLGTSESHPVETARIFRIHRNCSWVVCSGEGARQAFAEAFNVPVSRVAALPRPEYFELKEHAGRLEASVSAPGRPTVLVAPTLRKSSDTVHPLREAYRELWFSSLEEFADLVWSFHPLEEAGVAPGGLSELLLEADYVVTDYSSVAYEAYLLGKRVLFYVPDLDEYRLSPGLNADPGALCPDLCFSSPEELASALRAFAEGTAAYPQAQMDRFAQSAFDDVEYDEGCLVDFVMARLG